MTSAPRRKSTNPCGLPSLNPLTKLMSPITWRNATVTSATSTKKRSIQAISTSLTSLFVPQIWANLTRTAHFMVHSRRQDHSMDKTWTAVFTSRSLTLTGPKAIGIRMHSRANTASPRITSSPAISNNKLNSNRCSRLRSSSKL